jgi:flavin-binding protein dodecin
MDEGTQGSVARVTEISAISPDSFEAAIALGIERSHQTLRGLRSAWVKEQEVLIGPDGRVSGYKVNLLVTFVLDPKGFRDLGEYVDVADQSLLPGGS